SRLFSFRRIFRGCVFRKEGRERWCAKLPSGCCGILFIGLRGYCLKQRTKADPQTETTINNMEGMDLSLDEIIKKKRTEQQEERKMEWFGEWTPRGGSRGGGRGVGRGGGSRGGRGGYARGRGRGTNWGENYYKRQYQPNQVVDARYTIINNRPKPLDARDRLGEISRGQDARQRLQERARRGYHPYQYRHRGNNMRYISSTQNPSHRSNHPQHKLQSNWRDDDNQEYVPKCRYGSNPQLLHTYRPMVKAPLMDMTRYVEKDDEDDEFEFDDDEEDDIGMNIASSKMHSMPSFDTPKYPPPPMPRRVLDAPSANAQTTLNQETDLFDEEPDPFNHYSLVARPPVQSPPKYEPTRQTEPARPLRSILRAPHGIATGNVSANSASTASDNSFADLQLSKSMLNRLLHAPEPKESMGIFAKMPPDNFKQTYTSVRPPSPPPTTYRIVVSNLHNKVTQQDIQELFVEIGKLIEARLVRPGVAEVIYETQSHAELAVDIYHNRILDGLPMKCLLVHPRQPFKKPASNF
uniref:RRM domain-containing protein n=1 Tax=Anopheles dirus TaxID=7168 RepID=A0A182NVE4_9DIPT